MSSNISPKSFSEIPDLANYLKKASHRGSKINRVIHLTEQDKGKCQYNKDKNEIQFIFKEKGKAPITIPLEKIEKHKSKFSLSHWAHKKRMHLDSAYKNKFNSGINKLANQLNPKKPPVVTSSNSESTEKSSSPVRKTPPVTSSNSESTENSSSVQKTKKKSFHEKKSVVSNPIQNGLDLLPSEIKRQVVQDMPTKTVKDIKTVIELMKVLYKTDSATCSSIDPKELGMWISANEIPIVKLPISIQNIKTLLPHLIYLDLSESNFSDFNLLKSQCKNLKTLVTNSFQDLTIFDNQSFPALTTLNLARCEQLTDAGLQHLSGLTNLTNVGP